MITSRAMIGRYYHRLETVGRMSSVPRIAKLFLANQEIEEYKWLGQVPKLREWVGGRHAQGLKDNGISIRQQLFEATLEFSVDHLRRDKSGQVMVRIDELSQQTIDHWHELVMTLINNGHSTVCYDGFYFYHTAHVEGNNTTAQDNDLAIDISGLPVTQHGSTTTASPAEIAACIMRGVQAIVGFKDDQNRPMNRNAREFVVHVPINHMEPALAAITADAFAGSETNALKKQGKFKIDVEPAPDLSATDTLFVHRADGFTTPFIRQAENPTPGASDAGAITDNDEIDVKVEVIGEGSELEFTNRVHRFGVSAQRNVGYGMWQQSCRVQMT